MLKPSLFWVVDASPWRLAIMSRPRGDDDLDDEISALARLGVGAIVSMLEPAEARELGLRDEQAACDAHGIVFIHLPIPDRGVPGDARGFVRSIRSVQRQLDGGATVAVHCRAGIGRSGLLVASLLVAAGHSPAAAFAITGKARGIHVPDTPAQEAWLGSHEHALRIDG